MGWVDCAIDTAVKREMRGLIISEESSEINLEKM